MAIVRFGWGIKLFLELLLRSATGLAIGWGIITFYLELIPLIAEHGRPAAVIALIGYLIVILLVFVIVLMCMMPSWFPTILARRSRRLRANKVEDVDGSIPLKAWKIARVAPNTVEDDGLTPKYRFVPLASNRAYDAEDTAVCIYQGELRPAGPVPHDAGVAHKCGFYADMNLPVHANVPRAGVLLEVELYGEVIEGVRNILRGQYQRVMRVYFFDVCEACRGPLPRPATGLGLGKDGRMVSACSKHASRLEHSMPLEELAGYLQTEVRFRKTWLSGICRRVYRYR